MQAQNIRPATKAELVLLRKEITVSQEGLELLEHKRDILMAEGLRMLKSAKALRLQVTPAWRGIESTWKEALVSQSAGKIQKLASELQSLKAVEGLKRIWMSVKLSHYGMESPKLDLMGSVSELDLRAEQVRGLLGQQLPALVRLMNVETNIRRITVALKRCHRQVNALTQVVIPELEGEKKRIEQRLEEKEREAIFQVKLLKARLL